MIIFLLILCVLLFLSTVLFAVVLTSTMVYFGVVTTDNKIINKEDFQNIINNCFTRFAKKRKITKSALHPKMGVKRVHKRTYY